MAADTDKAEMLITFLASVFTNDFSQPTVLSERVQKEEQPAVDEDPVWDYLRELKLYKSFGPDRLYPRVQRELAIVLERLAIFGRQ